MAIVEGSTRVKVFFVAVVVASCAFFAAAAAAIIIGSTHDESRTETFLSAVTFPSIIFCSVNTSVLIDNAVTTSNCPLSCPGNCKVAGRIELGPAGTGCISRDSTATATGDLLSGLQKMETYTGGKCLLFNTDGPVTSSQAAREELLFGVSVLNSTSTGDSLYAFIGFFQQGTDPFMADGSFSNELFRVAFKYNKCSLGLQVVTTIDKRGFVFSSADSGAVHMSYNPTISCASQVDIAGSFSFNHYAVYISSYLVTEITFYNQSFLQIWAALGGALSAAAAILFFFFKEEVMQTRKDRPARKYMVFRLDSMAGVRDGVVNFLPGLDGFGSNAVGAADLELQ